MININRNTRIPSVEETLGTLRLHNSMMPMFIDFDKVMMDISFIQVQLQAIEPTLFRVIGRPPKKDASGNMKTWLAMNDDTSAFDFTKEGISLNQDSMEKAINSGALKEDTVYLLKLYQKYSDFVKTRGTLVSLLQNPISDSPSCDGHRMLIVRPTFAPQNTGRIGMRDPAIQNLPHALQELVTVPEGYVLLHTDSGQVEPRIVYSAFVRDPQIQTLIKLYNDAYYGLIHYIFMDQSLITSGTTQFVANEITDEMKVNRQSLKTYSNAVMYGSKSNPNGDRVKAAMIERIGKHPARLAWVNELITAIRRGETTVKTYFGTVIDTSQSKKLISGNSTSDTYEEQMVKLMINNPIQGTAADLMRISVYEANKILMNKGKKSYIIDYVHDAGRFCIHQDDFDSVSKELGDIVSYNVEGWIPIYAEPEFGRNGGKNGLIRDLY